MMIDTIPTIFIFLFISFLIPVKTQIRVRCSGYPKKDTEEVTSEDAVQIMSGISIHTGSLRPEIITGFSQLEF